MLIQQSYPLHVLLYVRSNNIVNKDRSLCFSVKFFKGFLIVFMHIISYFMSKAWRLSKGEHTPYTVFLYIVLSISIRNTYIQKWDN